MKYLTLSFFLLLGIVACNTGNSEDQKILQQAADLHKKALEKGKGVKEKIVQLTQTKFNIQVQGRALTEQEIKFSEAVGEIEGEFNAWEENHVEVPGFEHDHSHDHSGHDHDHHHHHHAPPQVTAEEMLAIQQEYYDSIIELDKAADELAKSL